MSNSLARVKRFTDLLTDDREKWVIQTAVAEAKYYPHGLCSQLCKTFIYIKEGKPCNQADGYQHRCPNYERAKFFGAQANTIPISWIKPSLDNLTQQIWQTFRPDTEFCKLVEQLNKILAEKTEWNNHLVEETIKAERERGQIS